MSAGGQERAAVLALAVSENLGRLGPIGWGVAVAVVVDMAKGLGLTRERVLHTVAQAWDTWRD